MQSCLQCKHARAFFSFLCLRKGGIICCCIWEKNFTAYENGCVYNTKHRYVSRGCYLLYEKIVEYPTSEASKGETRTVEQNYKYQSEANGTAIKLDLSLDERNEFSGKTPLRYNFNIAHMISKDLVLLYSARFSCFSHQDLKYPTLARIVKNPRKFWARKPKRQAVNSGIRRRLPPVTA